MSWGDPGGAGYLPTRCTRSARFNPDALDPNQDLPEPRLRPFHILDLQNLRTSELGDDHRPHGIRHVSLFGIVRFGASV